jgi:hypothetical protein
MLKACLNAVEGLFKACAQIKNLYTKSTGAVVFKVNARISCTPPATGSAHFYCAFTQTLKRNFNLLAAKLYPLSTPSIMTTNLIKE